MTKSHTPTQSATPFKFSLSKEFFSRPHGWADSDGKAEVTATFQAEGWNYIQNCETGNCAELAAHIVKCVNAYPALIEAVQLALDALTDIQGNDTLTENEQQIFDACTAALKTAKGE